jgi:hypothetical protein
VVGYLTRNHALGVASMAWSVLPLSSGAFDLCYISAALGGPLSGAIIRGKDRWLNGRAHREQTIPGT